MMSDCFEKDRKGLNCLIKAVQFVEGMSFSSPVGSGVAGSIPTRKRFGRKRAGKISRSQHNQLEKDRRATLRSHLALLAEELRLDEKRATTLAVLEAATDEIRLLKKNEQSILKQKNDAKETRVRLCDKRRSLGGNDTVEPLTRGHVVPPSPPNSEHSSNEAVRRREGMVIEPVSSAADTPESSPVSVGDNMLSYPAITFVDMPYGQAPLMHMQSWTQHLST